MRHATIFIFAFTLGHPALAETRNGRVIGVTDGDTLTLRDAVTMQRRSRIGGSDAPENGRDFGGQSQQHLTLLALEKHVRAECPTTNRYGREVCRVCVHGLDVGAAHLDAPAVAG